MIILSLLINQAGPIELHTINAPSPAEHIPINTDTFRLQESSPLISDEVPRFTDERLDALMKALWKYGLKRKNADENAGSISWIIDMENRGYAVEEHEFKNVREIVHSMDASTGKMEDVMSDPMDVHIYILKKGGKVEAFYIIREIHHKYKTGETSTTRTMEFYR